jgi:hypothetical protein
VHRGGAGGSDPRRVGAHSGSVVALLGRPCRGQRHPERAEGIQRGRTTHHHPADGVHDLVDAVQRHPPAQRKGSLVDHVDVAVNPVDRAHTSSPEFAWSAPYASTCIVKHRCSEHHNDRASQTQRATVGAPGSLLKLTVREKHSTPH